MTPANPSGLRLSNSPGPSNIIPRPTPLSTGTVRQAMIGSLRGGRKRLGKRFREMKGPTPDPAGEMLSALVDELEVDPADLGMRPLRVWRARSPRLVAQIEDRGEDPVATATRFMEMLLGCLRSDSQLNWSECERSSREYGRLRARQVVPLESLIGELAVYRRATMELISNPLLESSRRDEIVALAQSRLEDFTDHINQAIAMGYVATVEGRRPQRNCLSAAVSVVGRSSIFIALSARNGLATTIAALKRGTRGPWLKVVRGGLRGSGAFRHERLMPSVPHAAH